MILRGEPSVGESLTCEPGSWTNGPTFTYAFIDSADGQVLQEGPLSTYALSTADMGRTILCEVQATNAGGTGVGRSPALSAIQEKSNAGAAERDAIVSAERVAEYWAERHAAEAAAKERQAREAAERQALIERQDAASMLASALTSNITVQRDGAALVKLGCTGSAADQSCAGEMTLSVQATRKSGKRSRTVTVTIVAAQFSIVADKTATVHVDLNGVGRALLRADHGRLGAHLTILQSAPVAHTQWTCPEVMRLKRRAPGVEVRGG